MQWEEVRRLYPNTWVHLKAIHSSLEEDKQYIDEVAVIRAIDSDREVTQVLKKCSGDLFVYHTSKPQIVLNVIRKPSYRLNTNRWINS